MISIRRSYIYAMLICFSFSYLLMYVPTSAFSIMILLLDAGILVAGYSMLVRKGICNFSLFMLMIWMLVVQFARESSLGTLPIILYRTTAAFTSFTLMSSLGYEAACNPKKHDALSRWIILFVVCWSVIFMISVEGQRKEFNWGYANYAYMLFALFPFVFFLKNRTWRYICMWLVFAVAILSLKRTAFIILTIYSLLLLIHRFRHRRIRKVFFVVFIIVIIACFVILMFTDFAQMFVEKYLYRFAAVEEDGMGGRIDIWIAGLNTWWNADPFSMFFGQEYSYRDMTMHNDYLEMLISYGLVGLFLLIGVVVHFLKEYKAMKNSDQEDLKLVFVFSLCNLLVLMLVSHIFIYPYMTFLCLMPIGYCNGVRRGKI